MGIFKKPEGEEKKHEATLKLWKAVSKNDFKLLWKAYTDGANMNVTNERGETPLMLCAQKGSGMVEFLLKHGADPNIKNKEGDTALIIAAKHGMNNSIRFLLENEADIELNDSIGKTAVYYAITKESKQMLDEFQELINSRREQQRAIGKADKVQEILRDLEK
ncbi:MAG: ankyrin repeat domain-containing protein [Candidatus Micrarchaeota archaeon]|nr:ankyrin repeat domain-containing protein [Candidatus Micrarchaeota archaeon]